MGPHLWEAAQCHYERHTQFRPRDSQIAHLASATEAGTTAVRGAFCPNPTPVNSHTTHIVGGRLQKRC